MLHGIKKSAQVVFDICKPSGECSRAGDFYLLGDEYEIPWEYDRYALPGSTTYLLYLQVRQAGCIWKSDKYV